MKKAMHILEDCTLRLPDGTIQLTCKWEEIVEAIGELDVMMNPTKKPMLATPLKTSHTCSMGYRIWFRGLCNTKGLLFKKTYWGTIETMVDYIMVMDAVRIDHWVIESQSWVTVWLTSIEYASLKEVSDDSN